MRKTLALSTLLLTLLPVSLAAKQAAEKPPEPPEPLPRDTQTIRYELHSMDLHTAEVLAWDQCAQKERCRVASTEITGHKYLEVGAEPAVQEKIARALAREDRQPRTHGFQIVLLAASAKPSGGAQEVPVNVQKALADLKGFLPFKSYEVLDTAWISGTQDRGLEGRLVDHQGAGYQVVLQFHDTGTPADHTLFTDVFRVKAEPFRIPGSTDTRPGTVLIDTSFGLKEGETLVVGTSKVGGSNDALVVLVTAVPAS
jgi:hypothetical protein